MNDKDHVSSNLVGRLRLAEAEHCRLRSLQSSLLGEAAEWIDRASALLPLVWREAGSELAEEVSELLSQQPPQLKPKPVETTGKRSHDEKCDNCGAPWSVHLTNKLICPDAAIQDAYRFRAAQPRDPAKWCSCGKYLKTTTHVCSQLEPSGNNGNIT